MPSTPVVTPLAALNSVDMLNVIADAVVCTDENGHILIFNEAAERIFGYDANEVLGAKLEMLLPQRYRAEHAIHARDFALEKGIASRLMGHRREVSGRRKDGEEFPIEAMVARHTIGGNVIMSVVHRDITERKLLENGREEIAREMDHRIRNLLSVVQSLVSLSARSAVSVPEFKEALLGRLGALAATQNILRVGARDNVSLTEIFLAELAQYQTSEGTNVAIEGLPIKLNAKSAEMLTLIFHELATNSAKYGALSVARGRIVMTSSFAADQDSYLLEWREANGPTVNPPMRLGFGSKLIKHLTKTAFGTEAIMDYQNTGLVCRMVLPKTRLKPAFEAGY